MADRLIELLPSPGRSAVPLAPKALVLRKMTGSAIAKILFCAALGITVLIIAANRQSSSQDNRADAPAFSTASQPQTSRPSSPLSMAANPRGWTTWGAREDPGRNDLRSCSTQLEWRDPSS